MPNTLNWGFVGTGDIANDFTVAMQKHCKHPHKVWLSWGGFL
jgi:hypothetical protein